jgi:hypothetical protein
MVALPLSWGLAGRDLLRVGIRGLGGGVGWSKKGVVRAETGVGAVRYGGVEGGAIDELVVALIEVVADHPAPAGCATSTWRRIELEAFRIQDVVWRLPEVGPAPIWMLHSLAQSTERCRRALDRLDREERLVREAVRLLTAIVEELGLRSRAREPASVYGAAVTLWVEKVAARLLVGAVIAVRRGQALYGRWGWGRLRSGRNGSGGRRG